MLKGIDTGSSSVSALLRVDYQKPQATEQVLKKTNKTKRLMKKNFFKLVIITLRLGDCNGLLS